MPETKAELVRAIIRAQLGAINDESRLPPPTLDPNLALWYCYPIDSGPSIYGLLRGAGEPVIYADDRLLPIPIKTVLRLPWSIEEGYIVIDASDDPRVTYDRFGLRVPPEDETTY